MEPSSSSSLARLRDETVLSRSVEKTHTQDEQLVQKMIKETSEAQKTRFTRSFLEHGRDKQRITAETFCESTWTICGKSIEEKESRSEREKTLTRRAETVRRSETKRVTTVSAERGDGNTDMETRKFKRMS